MKNVFQISLDQTQICKNCFKDIQNVDLFTFFNKNPSLCKNCIATFEPKFYSFKVDGIKVLALYDYDDLFKELIYKFKGCYDYELHPIFLEQYKRELKFLYHGYKIIPAPSYKNDDRKRGFNHVIEIYKSLGLEIVEAFEKTEKFKQADHNFKDRKKIKNYIKVKETISPNSKILLVDDIYTTGSTLKTMISLLKDSGIKTIKALVLCKTKLSEKTSNN